MRTYNPLGLTRPKREILTKTITDTSDPKIVTSVAFSPLDALGQHKTADRASELVEKYVKNQIDFIVGEDVVPVTESIIQAAVTFETMQPELDKLPQDADRFTAEEFMAIAICLPSTWYQLMAFASTVNAKYTLVPN